jgi:hypothetical protein
MVRDLRPLHERLELVDQARWGGDDTGRVGALRWERPHCKPRPLGDQ